MIIEGSSHAAAATAEGRAHDAIAAQIEEDIVFGVYPPGSQLIEDRMQSRFDLTRHNLRRVMARLEQMGLVLKIPNRGVHVIEPTPDEIDQYYEIRDLLETRAAASTPLPVDASLAHRLWRTQRQHEAATQDGDFRAVFRLNLEFHRLQYSACPNIKLQMAIEELARKVHVVRAIKYGDAAHLANVVAQHAAIVSVMEGRDTQAYVESVRLHLPASSEAYRKFYELKYGKSRH